MPDIDTCQLPKVFPLANAEIAGMIPLSPELAVSIVDATLTADPREVTPQPFPERLVKMENIEASCVHSLANKFAENPHYCGASNADAYAISIRTLDADPCKLAEIFPLVNDEIVSTCTLAPELATSVVEKNLAGDPRIVTPQPSPERPTKRARLASSSKSSASDRVPTEKDPRDESFCKTLYSSKDEHLLNPGHILLRKKLVEVRRTRSGKVFFQCVGCQHLPRGDRVKQSTIAPRSVEGLYRGIVRFMMKHTYECRFISQTDKDICKAGKGVKKDATKAYWTESAKAAGLKDGEEGQGIIYCDSF